MSSAALGKLKAAHHQEGGGCCACVRAAKPVSAEGRRNVIANALPTRPAAPQSQPVGPIFPKPGTIQIGRGSEEHTSELQSPDHLVCLLLLQKKNHYTKDTSTH